MLEIPTKITPLLWANTDAKPLLQRVCDSEQVRQAECCLPFPEGWRSARKGPEVTARRWGSEFVWLKPHRRYVAELSRISSASERSYFSFALIFISLHAVKWLQ